MPIRLCITSLTIMLFIGCIPPSIEYGPRWSDIDGWAKLNLGMSRDDAIRAMGEPFLPEKAYYEGENEVQVFVFKIKPKFYWVKQNGIDRKPELLAKTAVWGDDYNLYCFFENKKLVRVLCPELAILEVQCMNAFDSLKAFKDANGPLK